MVFLLSHFKILVNEKWKAFGLFPVITHAGNAPKESDPTKSRSPERSQKCVSMTTLGAKWFIPAKMSSDHCLLGANQLVPTDNQTVG